MKKVNITVSRAVDGTYSAYCNEHPALFGMGDSAAIAVEELVQTLQLTKESGKESALFYPEWLDEEYEFVTHWDIMSLLEYYSGIITPTALGNLSGIHPKQIWSYMHGLTKPRKKQLDRIESALHRLGRELINTTLL